MTARTASLSLVVSTIGRPDELGRLLDSLDRLDPPHDFEVVLVDQTASQESARHLASRSTDYPHRETTSERGLSRGRNAGLALATGELLAFPDDDCWYAPDTLTRVLARFAREPDLDVLSGVQLTADGRPSMLRWAAAPGAVTRRNLLHTTISSTVFLRRRVIDRVGGFDEHLGAGSDRGFLAGEESDLLLRALEAGMAVQYDPSVVVHQDEPRDEPVDGFVDKMYGYGRGLGLVYRRHGLSRAQLSYYLGRKVGAAGVRTLRGRRDLARADLAYLRGAVSGYRDRSLS